jgi:hypothetical protein
MLVRLPSGSQLGVLLSTLVLVPGVGFGQDDAPSGAGRATPLAPVKLVVGSKDTGQPVECFRFRYKVEASAGEGTGSRAGRSPGRKCHRSYTGAHLPTNRGLTSLEPY